MPVENDCKEQGFSRIEDGCRACAPTFVDGKPIYPRIEPRGAWLCCVKCGGSYGANTNAGVPPSSNDQLKRGE